MSRSRLFLTLAIVSLLACQSDREKAAEALQQAETLQARDPVAAIDRLREATGLDPTLRPAFVALATLQLEQGDSPAAAEAATKALELEGEDASMSVIVARAALADERWATAEEALLAARGAEESLTEALPLLAQAQAALEKTDAALATFAEAQDAEASPEALEPAARLLLAQLLDRAEAAMDEWVPEGEDGDAETGPQPAALREDRQRIDELSALVDDPELAARIEALDRRANGATVARARRNAGVLGVIGALGADRLIGGEGLEGLGLGETPEGGPNLGVDVLDIDSQAGFGLGLSGTALEATGDDPDARGRGTIGRGTLGSGGTASDD